MRLSLVTEICVIVMINAEKKHESFLGRVTKPEDTGIIHTEAFEMLTNMHSTERPSDREELLMNALSIMASFCDVEDDDCLDRVSKITLREFQRSDEDTPRSVELDAEQAPVLVELLERMVTIVNKVDDYDIENVVDELEALRQEVEEAKEDEINDTHRWVFLSTLSIASESAKLWYKVYQDPSHALYGLHTASYFKTENEEDLDEERRGLQIGGYGAGILSSISLGPIVLEDAMSGINAVINIIMGDVSAVFENFSDILLLMVTSAIPASISAVLSGGGGYGDGYVGY